MVFEDESIITKTRLKYNLGDFDPPDILHIACHTKENADLSFDYSGIDVDDEKKPIDVDRAAAKVFEWSGCISGTGRRSSLVFFNACHSAVVGREVIQMARSCKVEVKPPYIIAWEGDVPNSLCNALAESIYGDMLVKNWGQEFVFELFVKTAAKLAKLADARKFVVTQADPARGMMSSTTKKYKKDLVLLLPDGTQSELIGKSAKNECDDDKSGEEETDQIFKAQYEIKRESIKAWVKFAIFGERERANMDEWLCDMELRETDKACIIKLLESMDVEDMDDVDEMEGGELEELERKLEELIQTVVCSLLFSLYSLFL
jgi:hypothetical protein